INRFCSSGTQAVALAADRIRLGEADVVIAAGTESMSMVPMGGNKPSFNPAIFEKDENVAIAYGMGITAEKVAAQWKVSREAQDLYAAESHRRAVHATDTGEFADEIAPYNVVERLPDLQNHTITRSSRAAAVDEGPRRDTSPEALAKLRPAFAAQTLAGIGELGLDRQKVNPLGSAIALGHPLGATGAIRVATLLHGLRRRKKKWGVVTMCVGTGMGAAGVFEAFQ